MLLEQKQFLKRDYILELVFNRKSVGISGRLYRRMSPVYFNHLVNLK